VSAAGNNHDPVPADFLGTWSGILENGSQRLRLKLDVDPSGRASLFSIDQAGPVRQGRTTFNENRIDARFPDSKVELRGALAASDRIDAVWRHGAVCISITFVRGEAALAALPSINPLDRDRLAQLRAEAGAPALAAASSRRPKPVKMWSDGERAVGTDASVRDSDVWHLGSVTKSLTATLVARLVDAGAVGWDDKVGDTLRDVAPEMNEAYRSATMLHLLSHRSGMPMNIPAEQFYGFSNGVVDARVDRMLYARQALAMRPIGAIGTAAKYSNSGYIVTAAMLEARLGQSWENLIGTQVFEPLRLVTAGFGAPGYAGGLEHPVGHSRGQGDRSLRPHYVGTDVTDNAEVLGPAARVHMSLPDLLRYLIAHRDRTDLLSSRAWDALHTPPFGGNWALGWMVRRDGALWHSGSNDLWYAEVLVDPSAGIAAAAVSNDGDKSRTARAVGRALLEAVAAA